MNLSQLYYYRTLMKTRSYQETATQCFISQPTLSISVSNLEKELGTVLVQKKRHPVVFTDDGEEFGQCVIQALQILDEHINSIKTHAEERNKTLRVGIVFSAQGQEWSILMREFWMRMRDKPKFIIKQGTTPALLESLKRGEVDVVIAGTMGDDPAIERFPCWSQPSGVVINKKNPLANKETIYLEDLRGFSVLSYTPDGPVGAEAFDLLENHNLTVEYAYSDEITLCSLVTARQDTVALCCNSWLVKSFDEVVVRSIADAPSDFHRIWLSHRINPPKHDELLHRFIDFVKAYDFGRI